MIHFPAWWDTTTTMIFGGLIMCFVGIVFVFLDNMRR